MELSTAVDATPAARVWPFRIVPGRWWPAVCTAALIIVSDTPLRRRSSDAVLGGSAIDVAILFEIAVYGLVGTWLVLRVGQLVRRRRLPPLLSALWTFGAAMAVATTYSPNLGLASVRLGELLVAIALATSLYRRGPVDAFRVFATCYVATLTGLIALGLAIRFPITDEATRFTWLFTHPVSAGALLAVSALMLFDPRMFMPVLSRRRMLRYGLAVVHVVALLANQSRGSAAAFVVGLSVWAWFRSTRGQRSGTLVISTIALMPVIYVVQETVLGFVVRGQSGERLLSVNSRTDLWTTALDSVADRPLTGVGYAASRQVFLEEIGLGGAHNAHVEVLVNGGLIGILPWVALILIATFTGLRLARAHAVGPMLLGLFAVLMVNSLTTQLIAQGGTGSTVVFVVIVAWMARAEAEIRGPSEIRYRR